MPLIVTPKMMAAEEAKLSAAMDRLSESIAARLLQIDRLTAALRACRDVIEDDRDVLLDSLSLGGDRATLLPEDQPAIAELDALLASIDAALDGTAP